MRQRPPEILQHPHPTLRKVCLPVEHFDTALLYMVGQMKLAITESPVEALGLAANQIGELKRVIVVVQGDQHVVMVNPCITMSAGLQTVRDGCLSVQGGRYFRARTRPRFIAVEYQDLQGHKHRRKAQGLHAAAIAHEIDHLDGKIFTDGLDVEAA